MLRSAVLMIAMLLMVLSFQNCGTTVPSGSNTSTQSVSDNTNTYEATVMNVREIAKSAPSDPTRIIVDGYFRSGCASTVEPVIDSNGSVHIVRAVVTSQTGSDVGCTMALVPFEKPVTLGNLVAGTHTVRFESDDGTKELVLQVD